MNSKDQIKKIKALNRKTLEVIQSKGADYGNDDVLSNFKQVSQVIKILKIDATTPEGYSMLLVILKICRISTLKDGNKIPNNESLLDSYEDLINYCKLAYLNEIESNSLII